jgi:hypothetical protein
VLIVMQIPCNVPAIHEHVRDLRTWQQVGKPANSTAYKGDS